MAEARSTRRAFGAIQEHQENDHGRHDGRRRRRRESGAGRIHRGTHSGRLEVRRRQNHSQTAIGRADISTVYSSLRWRLLTLSGDKGDPMLWAVVDRWWMLLV